MSDDRIPLSYHCISLTCIVLVQFIPFHYHFQQLLGLSLIVITYTHWYMFAPAPSSVDPPVPPPIPRTGADPPVPPPIPRTAAAAAIPESNLKPTIHTSSELFDPNWFATFFHLDRFNNASTLLGLANTPNQMVPFACHVCKRGRLTHTKLSRCTSCHIIRYCSRSCQSKDWKQHKPVCKALQKVSKFARMFKSEIHDPRSYQKYIEAGSFYLHASKQIELNEIDTNVNVVSVWNRQPHCAVCFTTEGLENSCTRCHGVAVCKNCSVTHGVAHEALSHSRKSCDQWLLFTCTYLLASERGHIHYSDSNNPSTLPFVPTNWFDYFQQQKSTLTNHRCAPLMCMLADGLSTPLTIVWGLCLAYGMESLISRKSLTIHLIGASVNETQGLRRYCEVSHCLPALKQLQIVLVGPNVPLCKKSGTTKTTLMDTERCHVTVHSVRSSYEAYRSLDAVNPVDFVMGQHSGCEDQAWSKLWTPAIHLLCEMQVPVLFTGYVMQESMDGVAYFTENFSQCCEITQPAAVNPFCGLTPFPDAAGSGFYHMNSAYFCFRGKNLQNVQNASK